MKEKYQKIIQKIVIIKINLVFVFVFTSALLYSVDMLDASIAFNEIMFWLAIILLFMFQMFKPFSRVIDMIEEYVTRDKFAKRSQDA